MNFKRIKKILKLGTMLFTLALLSACQTVRDLTTTNQAGRTIIVGLDDTFVPMGFQQKNGTLAGFDIDLAKAVGRELNQKIEFQAIDWNMKETELKNGTIDLIWNGYSQTAARKKEVAFSTSYLTNEQVLVSLRSSRITSFSTMKGKSVGLQNGSSGQALFENKPEILKNIVKDQTAVLYDNFNTAFLDLKAGRIQAILGDSIYAGYYLRQQHTATQYRLVKGDFPTETFAVGLRKQDTVLRKRLNRALRKLTRDGTISKLSEKWFKQDLSIKN